MRLRQATAAFVLAAGATLPLAGVASAQGDRDCGDFNTREEALEAHERFDPDDTWDLDRDNDGKPCEELPSGPPHETTQATTPPAPPPRPGADGQVHRVPLGGVDAGDGSATDDGFAAMPILLGVVGLGTATTTAVLTARRARRFGQD